MSTPSGHPGPSAQLVTEIAAAAEKVAASDPASAGPLWGAVHKLLLKAKIDVHRSATIIASRDVADLRALVRELRGEPAEPAPVAAAAPAPAIDEDTMRHALRAFRNRLKLTRLDAESKLGVGPMSGGRKHGIDAIIAPREYPPEVWEALANAGKLRRAGAGFYALAEEVG